MSDASPRVIETKQGLVEYALIEGEGPVVLAAGAGDRLAGVGAGAL